MAAQKEQLPVQSGFKAKRMTTPEQQQRVSALPPGKVSIVGYKEKVYYVYPTATKDQILVGNQTQYNGYKQALVAYGLTTSLILCRTRTDRIAFSFSTSAVLARLGSDELISSEDSRVRT